MANGIGIINGFDLNSKSPIDKRYGIYTGSTIDNCITNTLSSIPSPYRYEGLLVGLNVGTGNTIEYWFNGGTDDVNLIEKKLSYWEGKDPTHIQPITVSGTTLRIHASIIDGLSIIENDLTGTTVGNALDATQGKILKDLIDGLPTGGISVTNVTYSELTGLTSTSGLTTGGLYLITDYQTVHTIPNTIDVNTGEIEPILVTASSTTTLKPEAYSSLFPQDVIYYDFNNRQDILPGCTMGYIYRRIDTLQNNDIPFDFRNVKFRRWQIDVTNVWSSGTTYSQNDVVLYSGTTQIYISLTNSNIGVDPSTDSENIWKLFEWDNLTYVSWSNTNLYVGSISIPCSSGYTDYNIFTVYDSSIFSNKIEQDALSDGDILTYNNTVIIGDYFKGNIIGSYFHSNTIGSYFQYNTIGSYFHSNIIRSYFQDNTFGSYFQSNIIGSYFQDNTFGSYFQYNIIGSYFQDNTFGSYFQSNSIGTNFKSNTIGSYFQYNTIGSNFQGNTIGSNFQGNTIGIYFQGNTIVIYFQYNTIGNFFQGNSIGSGQGNTIGSSFKSNTIGSSFFNNTIGSNSQYNTIGSGFSSNTIGSGFQMNTICDNFGGLDFTSSTYVYTPYTKELFVNSSIAKKLIYDKMTIVDANA